MDLAVMTFNLRVDNQADGDHAWEYRKDAVKQVIATYQPHIIGTQEGLFEMVSELNNHLPAYSMIGEGRGGGTLDEYSAIFYKQAEFDLLETGLFWLSDTPEIPNSRSWNSACPRICTWGALRSVKQPTKVMTVFNTHLDHLSQEARINGIKLICSKIKPILDASNPVILTGDFNVEPDNEVIEVLTAANLTRVKTTGSTFHDFKGGRSGEPIDYIFTTKTVDVLASKVDRRQINGKYPSDHYPVIAQVRI